MSNWTAPFTGNILVECWGAGGDGFIGDNTFPRWGGGGGGGEYARKTIAVVMSTVYPYNVGSFSAGGANHGSWFQAPSTMIANGGTAASFHASAPGGTGGIGDVLFNGGDGFPCPAPEGQMLPGGGGGSSAGRNAPGNNGGHPAGGAMPPVGGAGADGGSYPDGPGHTATECGGGGGGAGAGSATNPVPQGSGQNGAVIIWSAGDWNFITGQPKPGARMLLEDGVLPAGAGAPSIQRTAFFMF